MFSFMNNWFNLLSFERSDRYNRVGRKLLKIVRTSKTKSSYMVRKKVDSVAHCISRRGAVPDRAVEGEELIFPFFEIAVYPTLRYFEQVSKRDNKRKSIDAVKKGDAKLVVVASNCPKNEYDDIRRYAELAGIKIQKFEGTSWDLGEVVGKPFMVSAIAVIEPGDSKILKMV